MQTDCLETLARKLVALGYRSVASYSELVHPVHVAGRVFEWDSDKPGVQLNQLCISKEMIERIREAAEQ